MAIAGYVALVQPIISICAAIVYSMVYKGETVVCKGEVTVCKGEVMVHKGEVMVYKGEVCR